MCGISGIISESETREALLQRVSEMCRRQAHRGPDEEKTMLCRSGRTQAALGFVRLAILDLDTGMQPICSEQDGTVILCNGQIYNYLELRGRVCGETFVSRGDIEVALHLYRRYGMSFLNELNGMYAGAILDPAAEKLVLFRDRFGIKPLYYAEGEHGFAFSSEIRPLFEALGGWPELNEDRLLSYFMYRYVPGGQTLFKNIRRVPPGCWLEYDLRRKTSSVRRYWNYAPDACKTDIRLDRAGEEFFELFRDAVRIRMRADVELAGFISGGIDSSSVAAAAAESKPEMRLYTATFEESLYDELPEVMKFLNSDPGRFSGLRLYTAQCGKEMLSRMPEIIEAVEEPISLGTILPTDSICRRASEDVKAVLTGEGADEIFAGYRKFMIEAAAEQYASLSGREKNKLLWRFPELEKYLAQRPADPAERYIRTEGLFDSAELERLTGLDAGGDVFPEDARPVLSGNEHPVDAAAAFEARCRLPEYVALRLDKLSMRHSLETRTPLLDYRLAEFAAGLPVSMKVNLAMNREKFICGYAFVKHGLLNAKTAFRKKQPFTFPMADWLSEPGSLPEQIREVLFGGMIKRHNILNTEFVNEMTQRVTAAGVGPQTLVSGADRLFSVIVFTLWYERFINR